MRLVAFVTATVLLAGCGGSPTGSPEGGSSVASLPQIGATAPTPIVPLSAPEVVVAAGDIGMCGAGSETTASLLDRIGGTVLALGDIAYYQGTRENFRDCYDPTWGRHRNRTRPAPGNHEYETSGAVPYFEYFGGRAGPPGLGYYSFDVGSWHVVSLNSNIRADAASLQAAWLRRDLADSSLPCTLAYWHHPLFSSGPNGDSAFMRELWRILYDAGAEIVLSAHDHLYERFGPQDPDGRSDPGRGMRQFVAGTGGAMVYEPRSARPNSEVRLAALGVLQLTLQLNGYQWEFIPVSGPGDAGAASCH